MAAITRVLIVACLVTGCRPGPDAGQDGVVPAIEKEANRGWTQDQSSGEAALTLFDNSREPAFRVICRRGARLAVNVPAFTPIGSEERLSFGSGGEAVALVADTGGDKVLGGMTGEGPIPDELKRLIIAPMSASYGAQTSGPHAPPADTIAGPFLSACQEFQTAARVDATKPNPDTSPCLVQDGSMLRLSPMRAIGTEPFWNARTDGRCVTYSTPEDQQGTRIWTKVESGPMGPVWVGAFKGKPFVLAVQPAVGCSDGMSDKKYDWSAELTVEGEKRRGCAERP